jgi:PAS domain S-box-containing protein
MKQHGIATSDVPARLAFDALALLEAIPDRAAILDGQGVIRALNCAWPADANPHEWVGNDYIERLAELTGIQEADRDTVAAGIRRLLDEEIGHLEADFRCGADAEGRARWCRLRARRIPAGSGDAVALLIHEDINPWKDAEQELVQQVHARDDEIRRMDRFREQLTEFLPHGIIYLASDGRFLSVNPQGSKSLSLSADEVTRRKLIDYGGLVTREDGTECPVNEFPASKCLATGEPQPPAIIGVLKPDGTRQWLLVTAVPAPCPLHPGRNGAVAVFLDVTARKRAEDALNVARVELEDRVRVRTAELQEVNNRLRENEARLREIVENIGEVVWIVQHEPRRILYISPSYEKVYGRPASEMYEDFTAFTRTVVPEDLPRVRERNWLDFREPYDVVYRIRHGASGELRWIRSRAFPIRDGDGVVIRVSGIAEDITDIKRAQEELLRLQQEVLVVTERERRRIGQDLHDGLGQHLTGIAFLSKSLQHRLAAKAARGAPVSDTEAKEAADIAELVQSAIVQSRALARGLHPVEAVPTGLMAALTELAARTEAVFRLACTFDCECPVPIHNDAVANNLYRIAQEAVNNATKYASARAIHIRLSIAPDVAVTLVVSDDGVGLPPDAERGSGMGLRIMRYRAEIIGGALSVSRRPEGGTLVRCVIPASAAACPTGAHLNPSRSAPPPREVEDV